MDWTGLDWTGLNLKWDRKKRRAEERKDMLRLRNYEYSKCLSCSQLTSKRRSWRRVRVSESERELRGGKVKRK